MALYIHQKENWTNFRWEQSEVTDLLLEVRQLQGYLLGKTESLGFNLKNEANLEILIQDVVQTSDIEGEIFNPEQVRSSIAMRLGLADAGVSHSNRSIDGVVDMTLDAIRNRDKQLSAKRLFAWHSALFPMGRSGIYSIEVGKWRTGRMQVVSGAWGRQKVHFEAPVPERLDTEMKYFVHWFNTENEIDSVLKAAIAHFWFITIHPFDDGNGRIARAIADAQLAMADGMNWRFYSMSSQINADKKAYYRVLEQTQKGDGDITEWLKWFLNCLKKALVSSEEIIGRIIRKHHFFVKNADKISNDRQRKILTRLLDGFEGNLTSSKYAKIAKTSADTALRDLNDLVEKGVLIKSSSGGRSTHYLIKWGEL